MKRLLLLLVFSASLFASAQVRTDFVIIPPSGTEYVRSFETSDTSSPVFTNSDGVTYNMLSTSVLDSSFNVSGTSVTFSAPSGLSENIPFSLIPYRHLTRASTSVPVIYGLSVSDSSSTTIDIVDLTGENADDIDVNVISFESTTLNAVSFLDLSDLPESISVRTDLTLYNSVTLQNGVYTLVLEVNGLNIESQVTIGSDGINPRISIRYPGISLIMFEYPCDQDIVVSDGNDCGGGVGIESVDFLVNRLGDHTFNWADGESWNEYSSKISILSDETIVISPAVLIGN